LVFGSLHKVKGVVEVKLRLFKAGIAGPKIPYVDVKKMLIVYGVNKLKAAIRILI
tara:strand:- start:254 stop:418 length:165 start_codon:yes stop_codon:yes gene_type:complete